MTVGHTLSVRIPLLGQIEKDIKVNITIEEIHGMDIKLKYSMSLGMEMLFSGVRKVLADIIENSQLLSWG